jgi:nicotinate-nucleotide adenylyltransferase
VDRLLLFGGSFNPIHHGHLIVARHAAERLGCRRIVLIPSALPPHKQDRALAPAAERLTMCRLAVAGEPLFEVSDWELTQAGPNYTLHTVEQFLTGRAADAMATAREQLCWLIGMDSLLELETWHRATELVERCTIVTTSRPGTEPPDPERLARHFNAVQVQRLLANVIEGPRIDISATDIRGRVAAGRSIRYLVPEAVAAHIAAQRLYAG